MLLPAFGETALESITTEAIESWLARLPHSPRTKTPALVLMHGVFRRAKKAWRLPSNPAAEVEKPPLKRSGDIQVFSPEEVWALVRAAENGQDGAIFLTAAKSGKVRPVPLAPDVASALAALGPPRALHR